MSLRERQQKLIDEFERFDNWEDRYTCLIKKGHALAEMDESKKKDEFKVKGCQSQVWIVAQLTPEKKVRFEADSDALIVKGLIAILLEVYSDASPQEILETPADFIKKLGLESKLSPSRANGLFSMLKQIKYYALAYSTVA